MNFILGAGCWLPFVSLHLKSTGLTTDEIRLISYVSPLFATLGPIFVGPLIDYLSKRKKNDGGKRSSSKSDRNAYVRTVLSITILLSAVFYCLLLSVSNVDKSNVREQEASFVCNENGAVLVQEKCNQLNCFQYKSDYHDGMATLSNCKFDCDLPINYGYLDKPPESGDIEENKNGIVTTTKVPATTTQRITSRPRSIRPEIDISNLDDFFGSEPNDDYDDDGSGEDSEFHWVIIIFFWGGVGVGRERGNYIIPVSNCFKN